MRRLMRRLIVIGSVTGLLMALNVGVALADHGDNPNSPFAAAEAIADGTGPTSGVAAATTPGSIPVGTALGFDPRLSQEEQGHPGLRNSKGFQNLKRNPNCPLHYQDLS